MDVLSVALGSFWFWAALVGAAVVGALVAVPAIADAVRFKAERRAHSAAAYQQLHDRQEFRRIIAANRDEEG